MTIRPATAQDTAEWSRMRHALWPDCNEERHALEIQQLSAKNAGGIVLVAADDNGSLCGFAELSIRHDHVEGTSRVPVPYLEGWYVDDGFRGQGIGRRLIEQAGKWATEQGFAELASDSELQNTRSIRAHAACGFTETGRAVHFVKRLSVDTSLAQ